MSYLAAECPDVGLGTAVPAAPETENLRVSGVMSSPPGPSDGAHAGSTTSHAVNADYPQGPHGGDQVPQAVKAGRAMCQPVEVVPVCAMRAALPRPRKH